MTQLFFSEKEQLFPLHAFLFLTDLQLHDVLLLLLLLLPLLVLRASSVSLAVCVGGVSLLGPAGGEASGCVGVVVFNEQCLCGAREESRCGAEEAGKTEDPLRCNLGQCVEQ